MNVGQEIQNLKNEMAKLKKRIEELEYKKNDVAASDAPAPSGVPVMRNP